MAPVKWIVGWMCTLINKWADQATIRALKRDIPSASLQGRADAPGKRMSDAWEDFPTRRPRIEYVYYEETIITPDRPPETENVWGGLSVDEICRELEGRT